MTAYTKRSHQRGFTIIELLATLVIISLISVIAIPTIGAMISRSETSAQEASIKHIESGSTIADTAGLEHDALVRYNINTLVDNGYLDISPDDPLLDGRPILEKVNHTYEYFGPLNVSETDGRNLVQDSNTLIDWTGYGWSTLDVNVDAATGYTRVSSSGGDQVLKAYWVFSDLDDYTGEDIKLSFDFINHADVPVRVLGNSLGFYAFIIEPGYSGRVQIEGYIGDLVEQLQFRALSVSDDVDFSIKHIKIEQNDDFSDWTPAPEDVR